MMNAAARALPAQPVTVLVAALGGQGGGVLADWIAHAARAQGRVVQATSTPGVAQRTGATSYYLEIVAAPPPGAAAPVLGLAPLPGCVDVLVCAELLEAARMLERGMSLPSRTTLVASTHRVFTTREKIGGNGADGRFDGQRIVACARALSRQAVLFDMEALRARHRAAISAVLFGALGGSAALGLHRDACEAAIRAGGIGVAESLAAFAAAWDVAASGAREPAPPAAAADADPAPPAALLERLAALPAPVAGFARLGAAQLHAYQDLAYARRYLDRVERVVRADASAGHGVAREAARGLALWMAYEDLIRVASLKARAGRLARIRREAGAADADVVRVHDFFKPSAEEFAAVLPRRLGAWLERRAWRARGVTLQSTSIFGALALRLAAALKPARPQSLRFAREQQAIDAWLAQLERALADTGRADAALALARLPQELKGYGETHAAGRARFERGLGQRVIAIVPR